MKPFGIGLVLCLLAPAAIASTPQPTTLPAAKNQSKSVDQTNLVGFTLQCASTFGGPDTIQVCPDGQVTIAVTRRYRSLTVASNITPSQLRRFFLLVDRADFPHLKHDYRNMNIVDAGATTATVTYVDRPGHQTTVNVYDYAGAAPSGFENLQRFLWDVIEAIVPASRFDKESKSLFSGPPVPAPTPAPPVLVLAPPPPPPPIPRPLPPPPPPKPTAPDR